MTAHHPAGSVLPFRRRWRVIHEVDLARLIAGHEQLSRLCDALEACADALPVRPDPLVAERLCAALCRFAERCEEDVDFAFDAWLPGAGEPAAAALIDHIRARRMADAAHAQDLVIALTSRPNGGEEISADALAYMLRCFFTNGRRAMDIEQLALLTLASGTMTSAARESLLASFCRRPA